MAVLNDLDRFHLASDVIDRLPQLGSKAAYLKQTLRDKLIERRRYINTYGNDLPEPRLEMGPYAAAEAEAPPELRGGD